MGIVSGALRGVSGEVGMEELSGPIGVGDGDVAALALALVEVDAEC